MIELDYNFNFKEYCFFKDLDGQTIREKTHSLLSKINELFTEQDGFRYWIICSATTCPLFNLVFELKKDVFAINQFKNENINFIGLLDKWEIYEDSNFPIKSGLIIGRSKEKEIEQVKIKIKNFVN